MLVCECLPSRGLLSSAATAAAARAWFAALPLGGRPLLFLGASAGACRVNGGVSLSVSSCTNGVSVSCIMLGMKLVQCVQCQRTASVHEPTRQAAPAKAEAQTCSKEGTGRGYDSLWTSNVYILTSTSGLGTGAARADLLGAAPLPGGEMARLLSSCVTIAGVPAPEALRLRLLLLLPTSSSHSPAQLNSLRIAKPAISHTCITQGSWLSLV